MFANHGHIYRSNYQDNTTQSEQKGRTLFPEGKQAWNPGGMINTEAHLPGMFCLSLLNEDVETFFLSVNYVQVLSHTHLQ